MFRKLFGGKNESASNEGEVKQAPPHYRLRKEDLLHPAQMFTDQPDGIREYLLRQLSVQLTGEKGFDKLADRYDAAAETISNRHLNRNLKGRELEEKATPEAIEKAIQNYKDNVSEMFIGDHPYRRLRVIYTRQKLYQEAISVCEAYIEMANRFIELDIRKPDEMLRQEYIEWIEKLQIKAGAPTSPAGKHTISVDQKLG